jgi:hypothetical protein
LSSPILGSQPAAAPAGDRDAAQRRVLSGYVMTDSNIRTAVAAWRADSTAAETTYGHISTWETGGVTDNARADNARPFAGADAAPHARSDNARPFARADARADAISNSG